MQCMPLSKTEFILCQFRFFTNFNMLTRQVAEVHGCNGTFGNGDAHDEYMMDWVGTHKVGVTMMTVIIINSPSTIPENKVIATAVVTVLAGWVFTSGIGVIIIIIIFIIIIIIIVIMIICCSVLSS